MVDLLHLETFVPIRSMVRLSFISLLLDMACIELLLFVRGSMGLNVALSVVDLLHIDASLLVRFYA